MNTWISKLFGWHGNKFSFLFTKFPFETNIKAELLNIKKTIKQDIKNQEDCKDDESFNLIVDDMLEKGEDAKPLDPVNEKPIKLMKKLKQSDSIQNPKKAFKFSITDNSISIN